MCATTRCSNFFPVTCSRFGLRVHPLTLTSYLIVEIGFLFRCPVSVCFFGSFPHQCARPLIVSLTRQRRERSDVDRLCAGRLSYLVVKFVFLILLPVSILRLAPRQCAHPLVEALPRQRRRPALFLSVPFYLASHLLVKFIFLLLFLVSVSVCVWFLTSVQDHSL